MVHRGVGVFRFLTFSTIGLYYMCIEHLDPDYQQTNITKKRAKSKDNQTNLMTGKVNGKENAIERDHILYRFMVYIFSEQ